MKLVDYIYFFFFKEFTWNECYININSIRVIYTRSEYEILILRQTTASHVQISKTKAIGIKRYLSAKISKSMICAGETFKTNQIKAQIFLLSSTYLFHKYFKTKLSGLIFFKPSKIFTWQPAKRNHLCLTRR